MYLFINSYFSVGPLRWEHAFSKLFADLSFTGVKLVPQLEDLCLQITVHAALYSPQFLLRHQADLDSCQHSLSVKELDKKVHRQLATS